MIKKKENRGQALVQVMVMSMLLLFVTSLLLRLSMHQNTLGAHSRGQTGAVQYSGAILNVVNNFWAGTQVCASDLSASPIVTCTGVPGVCGCTCTVTTLGRTFTNAVTAAIVAGACQASVTDQTSSYSSY